MFAPVGRAVWCVCRHRRHTQAPGASILPHSVRSRDGKFAALGPHLSVHADPSAAVNALSGVMPTFIATSRMNPAMTEMITDQMIPRGAALAASCVSSDMWAEAS